MIPVNSVLQVGHFPEIMQAEIDRRFTPIHHLDPQAPAPAGNFQAILIRSNTKLPEALVKQIPSIRMVATCGVGYDNLPLDYLKVNGIKASNTPGVLNDAVCELAIGMMLALLRQIPEAQEYVKSTAWSKAPFRITTTLAGKRVGIAGMGRIGQDLAERLKPFKVEIAYSGPNKKALTFITAVQDKTSNLSGHFMKSFLEGFHYVRKHELILSIMALDMFAVLFGGAVSILPAFVKEILNAGPETLGILRAAPAAGAVITGIYLARRPILTDSGKHLLISVAGFGAAIIAFGISSNLWVCALFLFISGCFDSVSVVIRGSIMQLTTPDHMRGRISAINGIFIGSSNELGALESGIAASMMGLVPSIVFGGVATIAIVLITHRLAPHLSKLHLKDIS